jgi:hypothetical protein
MRISIWVTLLTTFTLIMFMVWSSNHAYSQSGNCDPAYPDACIPSSPPDLNCPDVPHEGFRVLSPDPHGFDRDVDGIGCES